MSRVDVRVAAFVLAAVLLAAAIVVLVVRSWGVPEAEAYYWRPAAVVNVTVWLTYALTGALLYRRRPDTAVGWLLSGIGLGMLLTGFAIEYSLWTIVVGGAVDAGAALAVVAGQSVWVVPFGLLAGRRGGDAGGGRDVGAAAPAGAGRRGPPLQPFPLRRTSAGRGLRSAGA